MVDVNLVTGSGWKSASVVIEVFPGFESTLRSDQIAPALVEQHVSLPSVPEGTAPTDELFPLLASTDVTADYVFSPAELPVLAREAAGFSDLLTGKWRWQYAVLHDFAEWALADSTVRLEFVGD